MIGQRAAYQLIGFGLALVGVGLLNLAAHEWDANRFRARFSDAAKRAPEAFSNFRSQLREQEGLTDAGTAD